MTKGRAPEVVKTKLTDQERASLVTAMQRHGGVERRQHQRVPLTDAFPLVVRLGDDAQFINVTPKDISSSGLGFFHVGYVHPGTVVNMLMKNRSGEAVSVKGTVARCVHMNGRLHEVGALFETAVQVEVFAKVDEHAHAGPSMKPSDIYKRVHAISDQLKSLATQSASFDTILERVGELAVMLAPFDEGHLKRMSEKPAEAEPVKDSAGKPAKS